MPGGLAADHEERARARRSRAQDLEDLRRPASGRGRRRRSARCAGPAIGCGERRRSPVARPAAARALPAARRASGVPDASRPRPDRVRAEPLEGDERRRARPGRRRAASNDPADVADGGEAGRRAGAPRMPTRRSWRRGRAAGPHLRRRRGSRHRVGPARSRRGRPRIGGWPGAPPGCDRAASGGGAGRRRAGAAGRAVRGGGLGTRARRRGRRRRAPGRAGGRRCRGGDGPGRSDAWALRRPGGRRPPARRDRAGGGSPVHRAAVPRHRARGRPGRAPTGARQREVAAAFDGCSNPRELARLDAPRLQPAHDGQAAQGLESQPSHGEHDQPQAEERGQDAPRGGQPTTAATGGVGQDGQIGGGGGIGHGDADRGRRRSPSRTTRAGPQGRGRSSARCRRRAARRAAPGLRGSRRWTSASTCR